MLLPSTLTFAEGSAESNLTLTVLELDTISGRECKLCAQMGEIIKQETSGATMGPPAERL